METKWACANCRAEFDIERDLLPLENLPDLGARLEPGSIVPAGGCMHCGAFVYRKESVNKNEGLNMAIKTFEFSSEAEARAFSKGVKYVNDSAVTIMRIFAKSGTWIVEILDTDKKEG